MIPAGAGLADAAAVEQVEEAVEEADSVVLVRRVRIRLRSARAPSGAMVAIGIVGARGRGETIGTAAVTETAETAIVVATASVSVNVVETVIVNGAAAAGVQGGTATATAGGIATATATVAATVTVIGAVTATAVIATSGETAVTGARSGSGIVVTVAIATVETGIAIGTARGDRMSTTEYWHLAPRSACNIGANTPLDRSYRLACMH
jgi:hypothetical protein